jgi:hypothetical protein
LGEFTSESDCFTNVSCSIEVEYVSIQQGLPTKFHNIGSRPRIITRNSEVDVEKAKTNLEVQEGHGKFLNQFQGRSNLDQSLQNPVRFLGNPNQFQDNLHQFLDNPNQFQENIERDLCFFKGKSSLCRGNPNRFQTTKSQISQISASYHGLQHNMNSESILPLYNQMTQDFAGFFQYNSSDPIQNEETRQIFKVPLQSFGNVPATGSSDAKIPGKLIKGKKVRHFVIQVTEAAVKIMKDKIISGSDEAGFSEEFYSFLIETMQADRASNKMLIMRSNQEILGIASVMDLGDTDVKIERVKFYFLKNKSINLMDVR